VQTWASCSHTCATVPLSSSSIIWYQPTGGDALRLGMYVWRRTGHASHCGSPPAGSRPRTGSWAPAYALL